MNRDLHDSPAGAFFGQDVRELGASTALHCGIRDVHVDKAGDLGHITKSILYYHHVVASTCGAHDMNRLVCMAFSSCNCLSLLQPFLLLSPPTIFVLQEERRTAALQLSSCHDGDAVAEQVSLIHKVRGEQDGATAFLPLQKVPGGTSSRWVHT